VRPLLLLATHTLVNEIFRAARACTLLRSEAALPRKLTASFLLGLEHFGVLAHDAGLFLRAKWESLTILCECSDEDAAEKAINAEMILSVAVIDPSQVAGGPSIPLRAVARVLPFCNFHYGPS
jgi:hypothetical protein